MVPPGVPPRNLEQEQCQPMWAQVGPPGTTTCSHLERPCRFVWRMTPGGQFLVLGCECLREGKQPAVAPLSKARERAQTLERCVAWRSPRVTAGELEGIGASGSVLLPRVKRVKPGFLQSCEVLLFSFLFSEAVTHLFSRRSPDGHPVTEAFGLPRPFGSNAQLSAMALGVAGSVGLLVEGTLHRQAGPPHPHPCRLLPLLQTVGV